MGRLITAFLIISIYVYFFGIMGKIESIDVSISAETDEEISLEVEDEDYGYSPAVTSAVDENGRAVYTYATELNVINARKPSLADYTGTETQLIIPVETKETTAATEPDDFTFEDEDFDYTTPLKTQAPVTEKTTTKAKTTTSKSTKEEVPVTEVTPSDDDTTRPPEETEDAEDDELPYEDEPEFEDIEDEPEESENTETDTVTEAVSEASEETISEAVESVPETEAVSEEPRPETEDTRPETELVDDSVIFTVNSSGKTISDTALNIVAQAVMAEIGDGFDEEAIKAQAIATYTYIKYYNDNNQKAYIVSKTPSEKMLKLVREVLGKTLYYDGKIIQAVYSASSAGYTASSKSVWGVDYPYLRSKQTDFDRLYDINYGRKPTFTVKEMHDYIYNATGIDLTGDPSQWFTIESYVDNVYVGNMTIGGKSTYTKNGKEHRITGRHFRETIMGYDIRSHCFDITYDSYTELFTITTYGYGHGVGLSQHGANILASQYDYTYDQILAFYYEGAEIVTP